MVLLSSDSIIGFLLKCFQAQCIANEQRGHEFLFSCVNCFLGILDNLIQYFNKWAFVQVKYFELLLYVVHSGLWFVWLRDTSCYQKEKTSHTYLVWRWKGQSPNLIPPNIHLAGGSSWEEFCEGSKGHMGSVSNPTCGYFDQWWFDGCGPIHQLCRWWCFHSPCGWLLDLCNPPEPHS